MKLPLLLFILSSSLPAFATPKCQVLASKIQINERHEFEVTDYYSQVLSMPLKESEESLVVDLLDPQTALKLTTVEVWMKKIKGDDGKTLYLEAKARMRIKNKDLGTGLVLSLDSSYGASSSEMQVQETNNTVSYHLDLICHPLE